MRPPVGWAARGRQRHDRRASASPSSLLIATLAFHGEQLAEAKLGVLVGGGRRRVADVGWSSALTAAAAGASRGPARCSGDRRPASSTWPRPSTPTATTSAGPREAPVTVVEYGDFECPYCGQAEPVVRDLLAEHGDVRYVWRHLPLHRRAPAGPAGGRGSRGRGRAGRVLGDARPAARPPGPAARRSTCVALRRRSSASTPTASTTTCVAGRCAERASPRTSTPPTCSGVSGTPTFFINGQPPLRRLRHRVPRGRGDQGRPPPRRRRGVALGLTAPGRVRAGGPG